MGKLKQYPEIVGHDFKSMTVIKRLPKDEIPWKSHETGFLCHCQKCDKDYIIRKNSLPLGCPYCDATKPSGRGRIRQDMIGRKFGHLTVLERDTNHFYNGKKCVTTYWKCQCDCGNIISVRSQHFLGQGGHSRTVSCGCASKSSGELQIEDILNNNNINFKTQYVIKEFSFNAPFDFAIFNNDDSLKCLIEFDGIQHFKAVERFGGEEKFKIQQERDANKNKYCKEHGIRLIRIPYYDQNKLDTPEYLLSLINS